MKRLFSLLTMVIVMTGMVMAQSNSATTTQNGNNNSSSQDQSGNSNTAEVTQGMFQDETDSEGATAIQTQDGSENSAIIKQRDWGNPGNLAEQEQIGEGNQAVSIMYNGANESYQLQEGDGNQASYSVLGYDNTFSGEQDGQMNQMYIDQATWYDADNYGNQVTATQTGNENLLDAKLKGDENTLNFTQSGNFNEITGLSGDPFMYEGDYSSIDIEQINDNNTVQAHIQGTNQDIDVWQKSYSPGNTSKIEIDASLGGGTASQSVFVMQDGTSNLSDVYIQGNGNTVEHTQPQDLEGPVIVNKDNEAYTSIWGSANEASIYQEGDANLAEQNIWGSSNSATTHQDGGYNEAYIDQKTDGNTALQVQDGYYYGGTESKWDNNEADYNYSNILQEGGSENMAKSYQSGDQNQVDIHQDGSGNSAIVDQGLWDQRFTPGVHGSMNEATITQSGTGHSATILQNGNSNVANINQSN